MAVTTIDIDYYEELKAKAEKLELVKRNLIQHHDYIDEIADRSPEKRKQSLEY